MIIKTEGRSRRQFRKPGDHGPIAAELEADGPIRVVELGFFGGGEIPIANNVEIRRNLVNNATPLAFEIHPGGGPDLPIAGEQPFSLECGQ